MGIITATHDHVSAKGVSEKVSDKSPVPSTGGIIKTTMQDTTVKRGDSFYSPKVGSHSDQIRTCADNDLSG